MVRRVVVVVAAFLSFLLLFSFFCGRVWKCGKKELAGVEKGVLGRVGELVR